MSIDQAVARLEAGQVGLVGLQPTASVRLLDLDDTSAVLKTAYADRGFHVVTVRLRDTSSVGYFVLMCLPGPARLDDRASLRAAIGFAVDRERLPAPADFVRSKATGRFLQPGDLGHALQPQAFRFDPARARQLAGASWPGSAATPLRLMTDDRYGDLLVSQLAAAGIPATHVPPGDMTPVDDRYPVDLVTATVFVPRFGAELLDSLARFGSGPLQRLAELAPLTAELLGEPRRTKRAALYGQIERRLLEAAISVPLQAFDPSTPTAIYLVSDHLVGDLGAEALSLLEGSIPALHRLRWRSDR